MASENCGFSGPTVRSCFAVSLCSRVHCSHPGTSYLWFWGKLERPRKYDGTLTALFQTNIQHLSEHSSVRTNSILLWVEWLKFTVFPNYFQTCKGTGSNTIWLRSSKNRSIACTKLRGADKCVRVSLPDLSLGFRTGNIWVCTIIQAKVIKGSSLSSVGPPSNDL